MAESGEKPLVDPQLQRVLIGAGGVVLFLLGLFAAAALSGERNSYGGFALALLGLAVTFWQIKRGFDAYERGRAAQR